MLKAGGGVMAKDGGCLGALSPKASVVFDNSGRTRLGMGSFLIVVAMAFGVVCSSSSSSTISPSLLPSCRQLPLVWWT